MPLRFPPINALAFGANDKVLARRSVGARSREAFEEKAFHCCPSVSSLSEDEDSVWTCNIATSATAANSILLSGSSPRVSASVLSALTIWSTVQICRKPQLCHVQSSVRAPSHTQEHAPAREQGPCGCDRSAIPLVSELAGNPFCLQISYQRKESFIPTSCRY